MQIGGGQDKKRKEQEWSTMERRKSGLWCCSCDGEKEREEEREAATRQFPIYLISSNKASRHGCLVEGAG